MSQRHISKPGSAWRGGAIRCFVVTACLLGSLLVLSLMGAKGSTSILSGTPVAGTSQVQSSDATLCMLYLMSYFASLVFAPPLLAAGLFSWWRARRKAHVAKASS